MFGDKRLLNEAVERTRLVRETVEKAPKFQGTTFRGLSKLTDETYAAMTEVGATIEHKALQSWTMDEEIAGFFSGPASKGESIVLVSKKPVGVELAKGIPFSADEGEVLASKNKMKVVNVYKKPFSQTANSGKLIAGEVTYVEVELIDE